MVVVFLLNRSLSQYFAAQYIHERIQSGMVKVLQQCTEQYLSKDDFMQCADAARSPSWMESLPNDYVYCESPSSANSLSPLCQQVHSTHINWSEIQGNPVTDFGFSLLTLNAKQWSAVRQTSSLRSLLVYQVAPGSRSNTQKRNPISQHSEIISTLKSYEQNFFNDKKQSASGNITSSYISLRQNCSRRSKMKRQ
jgi:hypothetical protein